MKHPSFLPLSLEHWDHPRFKDYLQNELEQLPETALPLQQGLQHSSVALHEDIKLMLLDRQQTPKTCTVKAGIFYQGLVAGCQCADDPSPPDTLQEYCEVLIKIARADAAAHIKLIEPTAE